MTTRTGLKMATAACIALTAAACSSGSSSTQSPSSPGGGAKVVGALVFMGDDFFANIQKGMSAEAKKQGIKLVVNNTNNDPSQEANIISTYITQKVSAVVISPLSPIGSVASIKAAADAGIPVICYNTCIAPADAKKYVKGFVQTNQKALGTQTGQYAANYIKTKLGGKANIGILQCDVLGPACTDRKAGFKEALQGLQVNYVADQQGYTSDKSANVASAELSAHSDINVMWSANQLCIEGILVAIGQKQKAGSVVAFGTDISPTLANALLNGDNVLQATTGQAPLQIGGLAIQDALKAAQGQAIAPFPQLTQNLFFSRDDPAAVKVWLVNNS